MKRLALGMACASALSWCGPVRADEPAEEPAKLFESLDTNKDGAIGPDEVGEDRKRFFERLVRVGDRNEDKKLTRDEFIAAMTEQEKPVETPRSRMGGGDRPQFSPGQMFERMDRNKDGKFTKSEIPEQAPPEFRERLELVFTASEKAKSPREDFEKTMARYGRPGEGRPDGERRPDGDRPRPEGERSRDVARDGDRPRGPEGDRPRGPEGDRPRGPEGDRRPEMARDGERPRGPEADRMARGEGREEMRGPGMFGPGGPRGGSPLIRALDRNDDGKLNRDEIARIVDRFEELDRNNDGELEIFEIVGAPFGGPGTGPGGQGFGRPGFGPPEGMRREEGERGREMAREGDRRPEGPRDGDRPRPEAARDGERRPEGPRDGDRPRPEAGRDGERRPEGPRDGDRPRPEAAREGDRRPEGPRPEGRPEPGQRGPEGRPGDFFARLDRNGDGSISREEAPERMKDRFKEIDRNDDGKITAEELREAFAREFGMSGERRSGRPPME